MLSRFVSIRLLEVPLKAPGPVIFRERQNAYDPKLPVLKCLIAEWLFTNRKAR